jgi:thiol-disulfide isomerase/thioredoxin
LIARFKSLRLFSLFFAFFGVLCKCSNHGTDIESNTIKIKLDNIITDSVPFLYEFNLISFRRTENFNIQGLDSITLGNLFFQEGDLVENSKIKKGILTLHGSKEGKEILIFDTNNDNDLTGEKKYILNEDIGIIKISNVDFFLGDTLYKKSIYLHPQLSREVLGMKLDKEKLGINIIPIYRLGLFRTNQGATFKAALFNHFAQNYTSKNASLVIIPSENRFSSSHPVQYKVGDTIYLNNEEYLFNDISRRGDEIELKRTRSLNKNYGIEEGNYALKLKSKDIQSGELIEIGSSRKYTLLDFWGPWCAPCIELTDKLKSINNQFIAKNFQIISIAFDDSEQKDLKYLQKHEITWTNLFDDRNNSLIVSKFKVSDFPTFILLDPEGKILIRGVGKETLQKIVSYIKNKTY